MNNLGKTIEAKVINHKGDEYTLEDFDKNTIILSLMKGITT